MNKILSISILWLLILAMASPLAAQNNNAKFESVLEDIARAYNNGDMQQTLDVFRQKCGRAVVRNEQTVYVENSEFKSVSNEMKARIYEYVNMAGIAANVPEAEQVQYQKRLFAIEYNKEFTESWLIISSSRKTYTVVPRVALGLRTGFNVGRGLSEKRHELLQPIGQPTSGSGKDYRPRTGNSIGLSLDYRLTKHLSTEIALLSTRTGFAYYKQYHWGKDDRIVLNNMHTTHLAYFEVPVSIKYYIPSKKLNPFVELGFMSARLWWAERSMVFGIGEYIHGFDQYNEYPKTIEIADQVMKYHFAGIVGVGSNYRFGRSNIVTRLSYYHGLNDVDSRANRYTNKDLMYHFYDVLDETKLRRFEVSLSYQYTLSFVAFREKKRE